MGDGTKQTPYTREDVLRLIEKNGSTANGLDLSEKWFEESCSLYSIELAGIILKGAHLGKVNFNSSHLEGAYLFNAHLENASFENTHLENANLEIAHLEEAFMGETHLENANLDMAYLKGTYLVDAHLEGTYLWRAKLSPETRLEQTNWGNFILGEEISKNFNRASDTYRQLKQWYTNAGYHDIAAKFYYREKEANRKSIKLLSKHWNNRLAAEFFRALFGYGERWWNIVFWIIGVVFIFALLYSIQPSSTFGDNLYFSAVSFVALGYGSWIKENVAAWVRVLGALETFIGFFLMTLLLTTFIRKWTR